MSCVCGSASLGSRLFFFLFFFFFVVVCTIKGDWAGALAVFLFLFISVLVLVLRELSCAEWQM